jgi:hypothetical protein
MMLSIPGAWLALAIAAAAFALPGAALAGGASFGEDEDTADEGPAYFGFVRDTGGNTVPDAKVTVSVKDRGAVVTRTDALGTYKVPGFGKEIDPNNVEIACEKEGYKQVNTFRRTAPGTDPKIPIETECTLQRG